jgi:Lipid A 3-O-deacylase (PagL)
VILQLRRIFLFIFFLASQLIFAQENSAKYTYSSGAEVFSGFIVKHRDVVGNLITGHPTGFRLVFDRESYGHKAWEQRYNYPTFRATLSYYDLKNDAVLGKIVAMNAGLGFHLSDFTNSKNDWQLLLGYGIAYFNNPYDPDTNNTNTFVSSPLPWNVNLRLGYSRQLSARLNLGVAIQVSHFSNGSSKVPNYGMNIINANFGAKYSFSSEKPAYLTDKKVHAGYNTKSYLNIDFRMGLTELKPVGSGAKPYYAMSVFWNKRVSSKSIIDAGVEGFMNKGIEANIKNNSDLIEGEPDYKALGIMLGHELILEKLALVTQIGVYLYKPYQPEERIYAKIGLKYYFTEHIFGSFILKTHYAVAEVMEFGIGFRL